jgi:carboxyl-terminal processing protease
MSTRHGRIRESFWCRAKWAAASGVCVCGLVCATGSGADAPRVSGSPATPKVDGAQEAGFDAREQFDHVWSTIEKKFVDPAFNGVDWQEMRQRYGARAAACRDEAALAVVINEMLAQLRTSHTAYVTEDMPGYYAIVTTSDPSSQIARCGIGIDATKVGDDYYVSGLWAGDEGERAGLKLGDRLVSIDNKPFDPIGSFRGKNGKRVPITIQRTAGGKLEVLTVAPKVIPERQRFFQAAMNAKVMEESGIKIGYIRVWLLGEPQTEQYFPGLLNGLMVKEKLQGIILDLRDGYGGGYESYLTPFLLPSVGEFTKTGRDQRKQTFPVGGVDVPLVVLINGGSRSGKELLSYYLKKSGRALLVGERTAGFVTEGHVERISGSAILYYAAAKFEVDGVALEGKGVAPDVNVERSIPYANGRDAQFDRAKQELLRLVQSHVRNPAATKPL